MLSRGSYIGEIIDLLANIENQLSLRCKIGLTDINIYCESFFRDILNVCLDADLLNLNKESANNKGLDLEDSNKKIAFQITSDSSQEKVYNTIYKVYFEKNKNGGFSRKIVKYDEYKVFIFLMGRRKNSYPKLNKDCLKEVDFNPEEQVIDFPEFIRIIVDLDAGKLYQVYQIFRERCLHVQAELELQNEDGDFSHSIEKYIEPTKSFSLGVGEGILVYILEKLEDSEKGSSNLIKGSHVSVNNRKRAIEYLSSEDGKEVFLESHLEDLEGQVKKLVKIPRLVREFYVLLIDRVDDDYNIYVDTIDKIFQDKNYNWRGDLRELEKNGFVDRDTVSEDVDYESCVEINIVKLKIPPVNKKDIFSWGNGYLTDELQSPVDSSYWYQSIIEYAKEKNLLKRFFRDLDFRDL